jgi:hypothetical protein
MVSSLPCRTATIMVFRSVARMVVTTSTSSPQRSTALLETPDAHYLFRARVAKDVWARYAASRAEGIGYDNFKNAVAARQGGARVRVYRRGLEPLLRLQRGE